MTGHPESASELCVVDDGSFEAFFDAERVRLFRTLCLVSGNRGEAEELMQEAFVRVWERWDQVRNHPDPSGYLYRTAFNLFRDRRRRVLNRIRHLLASDQEEDAFARIDDREALIGALRTLSPRQRAALVLTELLDLDSNQAAELLKVKPVTVRVLASQGRAALKRELERPDD
jgi:RNA polymerase sigma-70 factor, ECF subfamily